MNKLGYSGYFAPKPTSACLDTNIISVSSSPNSTAAIPSADGCVLFLSRKKFKVISCESKTLALSVAGLVNGELLEDDRNIKAQNQVALFAVCEFTADDSNTQSTNNKLYNDPNQPSTPPPPLIICTTHLKSAKTTVGELYRQKAIYQILDMVENLYCKFADVGRTPAVLISGKYYLIC